MISVQVRWIWVIKILSVLILALHTQISLHPERYWSKFSELKVRIILREFIQWNVNLYWYLLFKKLVFTSTNTFSFLGLKDFPKNEASSFLLSLLGFHLCSFKIHLSVKRGRRNDSWFIKFSVSKWVGVARDRETSKQQTISKLGWSSRRQC